MAEYKKYDSQAGMWMQNARLAKDPQIIEGGEKPLVKLTVVCTSRSERHDDLWVEIAVNDRQADFASHLEKGDVLGFAGFPAIRRWGDDNEKVSFEVVRAELYPSIDLLQTVKERGWEPGAGSMRGKKKGGKKAAKSAAKKPRQVQDLDADDEDLQESE
jgi:hypothetical protein